MHKSNSPNNSEKLYRTLMGGGFLTRHDLNHHQEIYSPMFHRFYQSWNDLPTDHYVEDNSKFRERRYSVLFYENNKFSKPVEEPHFQLKKHNSLYGDIFRSYEPWKRSALNSLCFRRIVEYCINIFESNYRGKWRIQAHQFRINAPGSPSPEGIHRDGVDFVYIALVKRVNIDGGITQIYSNDDSKLHESQLLNRGDAFLINDHLVKHFVTPVSKINDYDQAYRDVMVITFQKILDQTD